MACILEKTPGKKQNVTFAYFSPDDRNLHCNTDDDLQRFTMLGGPWAIILLWGCSHIARGSIEREVDVCLHVVTVEMAHIS